MYVPIQKKMLLLTGMIFLGLFSTAYLVNSFTGNLALPAAEINFEEKDAKKEAEEIDIDKGYQIPGFSEEDYEYKEATLTEEEVLAVAEALDAVQEFRADHDDVVVWAWYDGFDFWYVDYSVDYWDEYYVEDNEVSTEIGYEAKPVTEYSYYPEWSYLTVIIQDSTGEVSEIIQPIEPSLTEEEVHDIAVNSDDGKAFLEEYPDAEIYIWFDSFQFWYVEFYPPYEYYEYEEGKNTDPDEPITEPGAIGYIWDYLSLIIDDLTGEIVEVFRPVDPELTEEEVLDIAFNIPEIQVLAGEYTDLEAWAYFDGFGYWYIDIYSKEHWEVWASVTIDDATAEVIDFFVPKLPEMSKDEVIAIAMEVSDVQVFLDKYDNSSIDAYFYSSWYFFEETVDESGEKGMESGYEGESAAYWYVYLYSEIYLDAWGYLLISDDPGEIFESDFIMPALPTITYDQAIAITQDHELTIEFISNYSADYGMYAYHFGNYYYNDYEVVRDYSYGEGGVWYIVYYTPTEFDNWYLEGEGYYESKTYAELGFRIDSETGDILDTWYFNWVDEIVPL
ncbi:MAG: hypothetical protein ACFFDC_04165 [Promethearchaeota archaeon]